VPRPDRKPTAERVVAEAVHVGPQGRLEVEEVEVSVFAASGLFPDRLDWRRVVPFRGRRRCQPLGVAPGQLQDEIDVVGESGSP
jgi:hypothetical protein